MFFPKQLNTNLMAGGGELDWHGHGILKEMKQRKCGLIPMANGI
nr:MAG TPA: hypothetical protein [Caudoviricetes sp.]